MTDLDKKLEKAARECSEEAVRRTFAAGLPITVLVGNRIVRQWADGHEEGTGEGAASAMAKRFRMVAGPNGSGKSTLVSRLVEDYAVNFYTMLNADRVARRYAQGGHDVPKNKIQARYVLSLANLPGAMPHLSRAYFFDNSGARMRHLASFSRDDGMVVHVPTSELPRWFCQNHL